MFILRLIAEVFSLIAMCFSAYAVVSWNHIHFRYSAFVDALAVLVQLGLLIAQSKCKSTGYLTLGLICDFILALLLAAAAIATTTRIHPCFHDHVFARSNSVFYIFFESFCHKLQVLVAFQYISFFLEVILTIAGIAAFQPSRRSPSENCDDEDDEKSSEHSTDQKHAGCDDDEEKAFSHISVDKRPSFGPPVRLSNFDFTLA